MAPTASLLTMPGKMGAIMPRPMKSTRIAAQPRSGVAGGRWKRMAQRGTWRPSNLHNLMVRIEDHGTVHLVKRRRNGSLASFITPVQRAMGLTGQCYCGAVKIEITGDPAVCFICHCKACVSWGGGIGNAGRWSRPTR